MICYKLSVAVYKYAEGHSKTKPKKLKYYYGLKISKMQVRTHTSNA